MTIQTTSVQVFEGNGTDPRSVEQERILKTLVERASDEIEKNVVETMFKDKCPGCKGAGIVHSSKGQSLCPDCGGTGKP